MPDIEHASALVDQLQDKRAALLSQIEETAILRQAIAFDAHTGDENARQKLDAINKDSVTHGLELESIDAAIKEAQSRLASAQHVEEIATARANAEALHQLVEAFVTHGSELDAALASMVRESRALRETLSKMHSLGCAFPSHDQLDALGNLALATSLMATPFKRYYEHVAPGERRSFTDLVNGWGQRIEENMVTPRLIAGLDLEEVA
jgi:hypothetical protein